MSTPYNQGDYSWDSPTERRAHSSRFSHSSLSRVARVLGLESPSPAPVTKAIILLCALVYLLETLSRSLNASFLFVPFLAYAQPYRFLASAFAHGGIWHLIFNMYALWLVGSALEPLLGKVRFALLYIWCAIGGNVAVLLLASPANTSWVTATVGASGAVFGLFGAYFVLLRSFNADATGMLILIAINLAMGFTSPTISWQSHIGGLVVGGAIMALLLIGRNHRTTRGKKVQDVLVFGSSMLLFGMLVAYSALHLGVYSF